MEEEKKNAQQNIGGAHAQNQERQGGQNPQGGNGNRHRRKKKKKGGNGGQGQGGQNAQGGNGGNQANQGAQNNQNNQKAQNKNNNQNAPRQNKGQKGNQKQQNKNNGQPSQNQGVQGNQKSQGAQIQPAQNAQNQSKKQKNQNNGQTSQNQGAQNNQNNQNAKKENRPDTFVYVLDGNLYINLTNKCSNACDFCVRNERSSYYGHYLWLKSEVTVEKVIEQAKALGDLKKYKEAVFCGFGEPTYRMAEMVALCDYFHEKGLKTRLNTNGQGNLINKRDIVPELKGKLDLINVSLNASCAEKYQPICRSQYGESGFTAMIEFAKLCVRAGVPCRFSIVDCIGEEEVEACKRLSESVRVPLYIRSYITDSE